MLKPTAKALCALLHTHFVRSGFLMLQPTVNRPGAAYPLRKKWVPDVAAYCEPTRATLTS
jgi:hypothetical protein